MRKLLHVWLDLAAADRTAIRELMAQSDELLRPLSDPLRVDFDTHRWLQKSREESYSDWLCWILERVGSPETLLRIVGVTGHPAIARCAGIKPEMNREVVVPEGHPGHTGRLDLVIEYEDSLALLIEVKLTPANVTDTQKGIGYRKWLDSKTAEHRIAILIAPYAERMSYEGDFRVTLWGHLSLELRVWARELSRATRLIEAALVLAFVSAVEQNLLGLSAAPGRSLMKSTRTADHLRRFLEHAASSGS